MTNPPVPRIDISSLSVGTELGEGGQGKVQTVDGLKIKGQWPAALKTYLQHIAASADASVLESLVGYLKQLTPTDLDWLHEHTAWPSVVVENNGAMCGFLMRAVPDPYYFNFVTSTMGTRKELADVAFLLNPDDYVSSSGIVVSERDRLGLLGKLAAGLSRLHSLDLVVGDLSPKNVLFSLTPEPSCFFIDCDAMRLRGTTVVEQVETPDWEVPDGEELSTTATDAYKLGLLAIRLFARDQSSHDSSALAAVSPELGRLADLSQSADPTVRPAPGEWISALDVATAAASTISAQPTMVSRPNQVSVSIPTIGAFTLPPPVPAVPAKPPSGLKTWAVLSVAVVALFLLIAAVGSHFANHSIQVGTSNDSPGNGLSQGTDPGASTSDTSETPSAVPSSAAPAGPVGLSSDITGDSQASGVATMFDTYFAGINNQNYSSALSVMDPNGMIDPNDSQQLDKFSHDDSTTHDSNIMLISISPTGQGPVTSAELTFQSHQDAGFGPSGDREALCTNWDIVYTLTQSSTGDYLIDKAKGTPTDC